MGGAELSYRIHGLVYPGRRIACIHEIGVGKCLGTYI